MQIEIKCALDFLLSYLYDKLPRRRVNLFGDELEKYLKLKLMTSDSKISLNINYKQNNIELIDPCLIAASKESAMDLKEILECWPQRLKLFIENGSVMYSLDQELNQQNDENVKIIYDEKSDTLPMSQSVPAGAAQSLSSPTNSNNLAENQQLLDMLQLNKKIDLTLQQQQNSRRIFNNKSNNSKILNNQFSNNNSNNNSNMMNTTNSLINNNNNNNNKSRNLNLNFNNLKPSNNAYISPTSPGMFNNAQFGAISLLQQQNQPADFSMLSSSSSSASTSSSSSHLSNPTEDVQQQPNNCNGTQQPQSNIAALTGYNQKLSSQQGTGSMFTTAAFAQTKFGSTKSKNNFTRQSKQQKMLPNEFSAYIRNKVKMLNGNIPNNTNNLQNQQQNFIENPMNNINGNESFIDYSLLNDQVPSISLSSYPSIMQSNQFQQTSSLFFKNNNASPSFGISTVDNINSSGSQSQLIQPELLLSNSTMNELEENLINNYFSSNFSSPSSSASASCSSSSSSSYNNDKSSSTTESKAINDLLNCNNSNLLNQMNNFTI